jgi:hypothetical protein
MAQEIADWIDATRRGDSAALGQALGVCPSIAFQRRGSNNQVTRDVLSSDLARLSDE